MFRNSPRVHYERNPLIQVICQLRFPTILSISAKAPYEFQDAIRQDFPRYQLKHEQTAPKLRSQNGTVSLEQPEAILNHNFISADGSQTVNLTNQFISLTADRYESWEQFAGRFDRIVAEFCRIYTPAFFERVGLRYVNGFSKEALGLESMRWRDLLQPAFVGLLDEEDLQDSDFLRCTQDLECKARGGCRVRLHAGPGLVKRSGVQEKVPRYILDLDVFMRGQIPPAHLTGALQSAHLNAGNLFRAALTPTLHEAMLPQF